MAHCQSFSLQIPFVIFTSSNVFIINEATLLISQWFPLINKNYTEKVHTIFNILLVLFRGAEQIKLYFLTNLHRYIVRML